MGMFRPPGRVTFCADRKSPNGPGHPLLPLRGNSPWSCLREGGFRFPPSLRKPFPLKRPSTGGTASPPYWMYPPGAGGARKDSAGNGAGRSPSPPGEHARPVFSFSFSGHPLPFGLYTPGKKRGEAKLRTTFFAKLSFKKAGGIRPTAAIPLDKSVLQM